MRVRGYAPRLALAKARSSAGLDRAVLTHKRINEMSRCARTQPRGAAYRRTHELTSEKKTQIARCVSIMDRWNCDGRSQRLRGQNSPVTHVFERTVERSQALRSEAALRVRRSRETLAKKTLVELRG
jgi:hypothetical protein